MENTMIEVNATDVLADEGTVVLFLGTDVKDGRTITFAVDHRLAQDIIASEDWQGGGSPLVFVEPWQIMGRAK